jgi:calcineurin-like phosphoesterase
MRILMIGDIVGRPGRRAVKENVTDIRKEFGIDFVIANGENAAGGNGITRETAVELFSCGIDVITGGNHIWDKKESYGFISQETRLIRPANYPPGVPGSGYRIFPVDEINIAVVNLAGRVFMPNVDCPFRKVDEILAELASQA